MLKFDEMDNGTKGRTLARVFVSIYTALAVWKVAYELFYNEMHIVWLAGFLATALMLFGLGVDMYTLYKNQDFTAEGMMGTNVTRTLKADPTMVVELRDGDEDDEDEDEPSITEVGEETIEEGED